MKLFLDTSVLLAACSSSTGASREIFRRASNNHWGLVIVPYVINEVEANLPRLAPVARSEWMGFFTLFTIMADVLTLDRPTVFSSTKDRPILFAAVAWADVLLTLDQRDFGHLMSHPFYNLDVRRPGQFLEEQRSIGCLI